jgi:peptide/nickel transport system substrate-binding protein
MPSFFTLGAPLYTEEGGENLKGPRKLDAAKRSLAESGYAGQPVTCMAAQDNPANKAWGDVTIDMLMRIGIKVDFAAIDWGTLVARVSQKSPPDHGEWQIFHASMNGVDRADPTKAILRANAENRLNGWADAPQVEAEIAAWYAAKTLDEEKIVARRLNKRHSTR